MSLDEIKQAQNNNIQDVNFDIIEEKKDVYYNYYEDYITDAFNLKRRLSKVTAYLPLKIFTKLNLNDRLIVNNKSYIINQITTNLLTGKSELELLNEV